MGEIVHHSHSVITAVTVSWCAVWNPSLEETVDVETYLWRNHPRSRKATIKIPNLPTEYSVCSRAPICDCAFLDLSNLSSSERFSCGCNRWLRYSYHHPFITAKTFTRSTVAGNILRCHCISSLWGDKYHGPLSSLLNWVTTIRELIIHATKHRAFFILSGQKVQRFYVNIFFWETSSFGLYDTSSCMF